MNKNNIILQIIIGFLLTDFFIGFFHWIEDTYFCYNSSNPIIRYIAQDNELHHYYPRDIVVSSYLENMTVTGPLSILIILVTYLINKKLVLEWKYIFIIFLLFGSTANIFHRFLHMRKCEKPLIINFLQDNYIFSNSEQHKEHHKKANDNYCVLFYFTNVILQAINFWYILEQLVYYTTGLERRKPKQFDDYKHIHNFFHKISQDDCPRTLTKGELQILKNHLKRKFENVKC